MSPSVRRPIPRALIWRANGARSASDLSEERQELAHIYEERGLEPKLAEEVASQLMARDALDAHSREELGISGSTQPKPIQAAFASALAFSIGAALPTLSAFLAPPGAIVKAVPASALVFLVALGALGAWAGGAPMIKPALESWLLGSARHGGDGGDRRVGRQGRLALP